MNKLTHWINRFPYNHPNFGIPGLMKYLVIGNVAVYLMAMFSSTSAVSFLAFSWYHILQGEIWRLVTFIFVPMTFSGFSFAIQMYMYYFIGNILEREWGTGRFTLYYVSGVVLTILGAVFSAVVSGGNATIWGTSSVYMTMFMAFAMLYPNNQVLLMFIIPIKMKYLAIAGGALIALEVVQGLFAMDIVAVVVPILVLMNFFVFFYEELGGLLGYQVKRAQYQNSSQTIHFKSAAKKHAQQQKQQGYRHKCEVCGRTDVDDPTLQFRYCSRCAGYHCYCQDHILNHTHHTE